MLKIIDFPVIKYYFKSLKEFDSFSIPSQVISNIKLFQKDKIICLTGNNDILIYNIIEKKLLCKLESFSKKKSPAKIILYKYDKFMIYSQEDLRIFQFAKKREENNYVCRQLTKINEEADDIIIKNNTIFSLNNGDLNIYVPINKTKFELQTKIFFPKAPNEFSDYYFLFIKNDKIKIIKYQDYTIQFWSIKYYKLKYENSIEIDNDFLDYDFNYALLNDKDTILFVISNFFYLYSYQNKKILKKIKNEKYYGRIKDIFITKNNIIYFNDKLGIYTLDTKNQEVFQLINTNYELNNNLIVLASENKKEIFIINSNNQIHFMRNDTIYIIKKDLLYMILIFLFLFFPIFYNTRMLIISMKVSLELMLAIFIFIKIFDGFNKFEEALKRKNYLILGGLLILFISSFSNINYII